MPHRVKGEAIVVFVVLRPGIEPTEALRDEIRAERDAGAWPGAQARQVLFVTQLPKTRNGKVLRRLIRARHLGKTDLGDLSSLESPDALEANGAPTLKGRALDAAQANSWLWVFLLSHQSLSRCLTLTVPLSRAWQGIEVGGASNSASNLFEAFGHCKEERIQR